VLPLEKEECKKAKKVLYGLVHISAKKSPGKSEAYND